MIIGEVTCDLANFDVLECHLNMYVLTHKSDIKEVKVGGSNVMFGTT